MNLFDLIKPKKNVNTQPLQLVQAAPNAEGGLDAQVTEWQPRPTKAQKFGNKLADLLFGEAAPSTDSIGAGNGQPITMKDEITGENITYTPQNTTTISQNPRVGGLFRDLGAGARENFATGFAANNLTDNMTADGRKKGFAYRLGEGLGSVGRVLESPLGRGLLTAAIVGATGGGGLQALAYGGLAGSLNQKLRYNDKMYRDEMLRNAYNSLRNSPEFNTLSSNEQEILAKQVQDRLFGGNIPAELTEQQQMMYENNLRQAYNQALSEKQQAQINDLTNQVNNMRGYVTDDVYNNFVRAQQLRDNADYRNLMANLQMQNNQAMQDLRRDQAEYQKIKDAADREDRALTRAITARGQDLTYGLGMARLQADATKEANKAAVKHSAKQQDALSTLNQIELIRGLVAKNPKATGLAKGMVTGDLLNRFDNNPNNIQTRTAIDALKTKIRHDLTGAQFSPKEAREYEKFLPNVRDNAQIINAKLDALEKRYYSDFGISLTGASNGARISKNTTKVGKYTVRVK